MSNIVSLTAREHFICHRLLVKITSGRDKSKMVLAIQMMMSFSKTHQEQRYTKLTSTSYEHLKKLISLNISLLKRGVPLSQQACANIKASRTPDMRRRISEAQRGRSKSSEEKQRLSDAARQQMADPLMRQRLSEAARNRPPVTDETRQKMSKAHLGMKNQAFASYSFVGRKHSAESILKMKQSHTGKSQAASAQVTCAHCLKTGASRGMGLHFDRCKLKRDPPL